MKNSLLFNTIVLYWTQRDNRERKLLIWASVFLVSLLIYSIGFEPAFNGRRQLQKHFQFCISKLQRWMSWPYKVLSSIRS